MLYRQCEYIWEAICYGIKFDLFILLGRPNLKVTNEMKNKLWKGQTIKPKFMVVKYFKCTLLDDVFPPKVF